MEESDVIELNERFSDVRLTRGERNKRQEELLEISTPPFAVLPNSVISSLPSELKERSSAVRVFLHPSNIFPSIVLNPQLDKHILVTLENGRDSLGGNKDGVRQGKYTWGR
jgi:hypothetical protein